MSLESDLADVFFRHCKNTQMAVRAADETADRYYKRMSRALRNHDLFKNFNGKMSEVVERNTSLSRRQLYNIATAQRSCSKSAPSCTAIEYSAIPEEAPIAS